MSDLKNDKPKNIFKISTNLLARKAYFSFELEDRLKKRGFSQNEIKQAISELTRYGYIDDVAILKSRILKLSKKQGPYLIKMQLQYELRSQEFDIESFVDELITDKMQLEVIEKRLRNISCKEELKKQIAKLLRLGFSKELVFGAANCDEACPF